MVAVQAENASAVYNSWKSGKLESTDSADTVADGLALRQAFQLPMTILNERLDDFVLVSEDEIKHAVKLYLELCHTVAEGAGAATLAAALKARDSLKGRKVALVLSGGNLAYSTLKQVVEKY